MIRSTTLILTGLVLFASGAAAQIPEGMDDGAFLPHPEAEAAIGRLYSPFCAGFMLDVCTSPQAGALRDSIQMLAYQGWTSDQLVDWMLGNYGERYRAVPLTSGMGIWAWVLPFVGLMIGAGLVIVALRRFNPAKAVESSQVSGPVTRAPITSEEEDRLRAAIREIELQEDPTF